MSLIKTGDSFLFGTNNFKGMKLGSQNEVNIETKKWNELKAPNNCNSIKKIVCGAQFVAVCNELNEIYYFGNFSQNKTIHFWNKLEYKNNLNIKNLFANFDSLLLQLENDELIIYKNGINTGNKNYNDSIKLMGSGPLCSYFFYIVCKDNNVIRISDKFTETNIFTNDITTSIKCIGCCSGATLIVTIDNKIYGAGSSVYGELSEIDPSTYKYQYISTPFEKESQIIDVKGGYYHFIVLLKNGTVYGIGYNDLGATCIDKQDKRVNFTKFTNQIFKNDFINRIYCSSRGTVLISDKYFYFIGEVVVHLTEYNNTIDKNIENIIVNNFTVQKVKILDNKYNDVVAGGWHYIIYNNSDLKESKCLQYFENNLLNLCRGIYYNDISIIIH